MKYWAYLNDEVSQVAYSEAELQQLPGFGPDILICSEVSAVSSNPEWKPIKELLPHLIRPKAPDFSKFRPKAPVPPAPQGNQNTLPVPEVLPAGVNAVSSSQKPQNVSSNNPNDALLAQLQSLTAKISSLEDKIVEQEKELAAANDKMQDEPEIQNMGEATFVSDPQNDQEDDVLEVPFDNDFEVPFDSNKSSEEIAREAEALLSDHDNEIEEYNADDPNAEFMPFDSSEIQGMLEDTVRKENAFDNPYEKTIDDNAGEIKTMEENEDKTQPKTRTFIAQDLISKTTFDLSDKKEEPSEEKEGVVVSETETSAQEEPQEKENAIEENVEEQPVVEEETAETAPSTEEPQEKENAIEENIEEQPVVEEETAETAPSTEEQKIEEANQEEVEKTEEESKEESKVEEESTDSKNQVTESSLVFIDTLPLKEGNVIEEPKPEEESVPEPQLNSLDGVPEVKTTETQEEIQPLADLVPLAALPVAQETLTEEHPVEEKKVQELPTLDDNKEEGTNEEPVAEGEVKDSLKEDVKEEQQDTSESEIQEQDVLPISNQDENIEQDDKQSEEEDLLKTMLSKEELNEDPSTEPMDEYEMTQGFTPTEDFEHGRKKPESSIDISKEGNEKLKIDNTFNSEISATSEKTEESNVDAENDSQPQKENKPNELSMTGISISNDPTTAAVLDEIAQEKSQDMGAVTSTDKLFEELEKTYREGGDSSNISELVESDNKPVEINTAEVNNLDGNEESLNQEFAKEDEFLKTFTTSVEEVFLDQPTAIISDYVPPSDDTEHSKPVVMTENIMRKKPSDIKTVPLVPEAMGQEIWSAPYVESATAKVRRKSTIGRFILFSLIIFAGVIVLFIALEGLVWVNILPEKLSPSHIIIGSYYSQKSPANNVVTEEDLDMAPEMIDQNVSAPAYQNTGNEISDVVESVKSYAFIDGTTLAERIMTSNKVSDNQLEWTVLSTEEPDIYSVAVRLPQNDAGQGFSYRFNYDYLNKTLAPTTSESKNIMENYLK